MCGRFSLTQTGDSLAAAFRLQVPLSGAPRYNIAPSQPVVTLVATSTAPTPHGQRLRWGLIPSWAKDPTMGNRLINARAETVAEKPSFRAAFKRRRCLVLADGFYEWQRQDRNTKQPYYMFLKDHRPFAFAGLWEHWHDPNSGDELQTCTILTTAANELMQPIHNRMPVILAPEHYAPWLDPDYYQPQVLQEMLHPYGAAAMECYPISTLVNNPRNDSPECMAPLREQ
ncbi:Putative SOS response-associated peptidase YoqW [Halomicronema hongdechloris C2206]|uniref:Abasic site processing protein n=1 Tax=Halomicronema hongdechloris C2206 TaxID=1641165 RepID=A0A1Z3HQB9_9CYAN|nr:SOS response-associated peptidase [Halomicronema hongdechloris]ASC72452.1 Putative SOS response-associated peptidase YoqW [Halomicronema hongdechloris C2206]